MKVINRPKKIEIITHYPKGGIGGDYCDVEVLFDGVVVFTADDYYHDKGNVQADAWTKGVLFALGSKTKIKYTDIDDRDEY